MTKSIGKDSVRCFLESVFSSRPPPGDPFVRQEWIGAAFDRNRYEQLAPAEWWKALVTCSSSVLGEEEIFAIQKDALPSTGSNGISTIANSEGSIFAYLDQDKNFLRDQYLVGKSLNWACLLDQDVSLFGGDEKFIEGCFNQIGGRQYLHAKMIDDFIGERAYSANPSDEFIVSFESYFMRLLWAQRR